MNDRESHEQTRAGDSVRDRAHESAEALHALDDAMVAESVNDGGTFDDDVADMIEEMRTLVARWDERRARRARPDGQVT